MSKLHRLFHLTRVTEYLPPAEPIHRGKCFGKICFYHLFLSAVDLKGKDKTALKERENRAPTRHTEYMLPGIYASRLCILSGPSDLAVAQSSVAATVVSIGSPRLSETKELKDPQTSPQVDFLPNTEKTAEILSKITQSPLSQRQHLPCSSVSFKSDLILHLPLLIFKTKEAEIRESSLGHLY